METAITALIVISLLVLSVLMVTERSLSAQSSFSESLRQMQDGIEERSRTGITPIKAETKALGATVEITLKNTGNTKLADFGQWDVILEYDAGGGNWQTRWYSYTASLASNQWTVAGIYLNAATSTSEIFEPNIFNPGEEMVIQVKVSPAVGSPTANWATIATPNGISASTVFTR
jgi:hypothetical protein